MRRLPLENFRCPAALARLFLVMALGLGLDLWTKSAAVDRLAVVGQWVPYQSRTSQVVESFTGLSLPSAWIPRITDSQVYQFIPGYLHFTITMNRGAVFGMGAGNSLLFIGVSLAAVLFLLVLFASSGRQRLYQIILGMLLAGVLGNMYDRLRYDYVRDMIHALPRWPDLFPWIFNVADTLLCTGVGLMILYSLLTPTRPDEQSQPDTAPATKQD